MIEYKKFNILYVDDEPNNLLSFKASFRQHYTIYTATSARQGLEIIRSQPIHIVITDQRMPEMTGVEFLEQIVPEFPDTIRMILTGFSDMEYIIQAINTGRLFRYITKPWDFNELKITIDKAIEYYFLQRQNKELVEKLQRKVEEQERIVKAFQKYVPASIVEEYLNNKEDVAAHLQGEVRNVSVMFVDVRNFTGISEKLDAKQVVALLNDFYSFITDSVRKYNGSVNKFIGDEVMAVFGAPVGVENSESAAVLCAKEIVSDLMMLNSTYEPLIGNTLKIGIGINSGPVVAGNMGNEEKLEYSITGDTVNVAKRIEQQTKAIPNAIIISESTYTPLKHIIDVEPLEPVELKGKETKAQLYLVK